MCRNFLYEEGYYSFQCFEIVEFLWGTILLYWVMLFCHWWHRCYPSTCNKIAWSFSEKIFSTWLWFWFHDFLFQSWKYPCAQVIFDSDPAPVGRPVPAQIEEMSQAMIRWSSHSFIVSNFMTWKIFKVDWSWPKMFAIFVQYFYFIENYFCCVALTQPQGKFFSRFQARSIVNFDKTKLKLIVRVLPKYFDGKKKWNF